MLTCSVNLQCHNNIEAMCSVTLTTEKLTRCFAIGLVEVEQRIEGLRGYYHPFQFVAMVRTGTPSSLCCRIVS